MPTFGGRRGSSGRSPPLSVFLLGYALGQLFGGSFSDQIGRKRIGYIGLTLYVATAPGLEGVSGQYFDDCRPKDPSAEARDEAVAARLWAVSEELTQVATYERGSLEQGHR